LALALPIAVEEERADPPFVAIATPEAEAPCGVGAERTEAARVRRAMYCICSLMSLLLIRKMPSIYTKIPNFITLSQKS
jgi:hypothetical protein